MSKDQTLGGIIFLACLIFTTGYIIVVAAPQTVKGLMPWLPWASEELQFGAIATVVLIAFLGVMVIGAWIGWTMATTPPPKPVEELETEMEKKSE